MESQAETHNECCCKCGELIWEFNDKGFRVVNSVTGEQRKICSDCVEKMMAGKIRREDLVKVLPEERV